MIRRCYNPRSKTYSYYGGAGISVYDEWRGSFLAFLLHIGQKPSPRHTVDRINVAGNYEPGNVRWAIHLEQMRNTRVNRLLEYRGETRCMSEWAEVFSLGQHTLKARLKYGWSLERALNMPVDTRFHHKLRRKEK